MKHLSALLLLFGLLTLTHASQIKSKFVVNKPNALKTSPNIKLLQATTTSTFKEPLRFDPPIILDW